MTEVFQDSLTWKRGKTHTGTWEFFEDEEQTTPENFTGYTAKMWVKRTHSDEETAAIELSSPSSGLVVTASPASIAYEVSAAQTAALKTGRWRFDVRVVPPSGKPDYVVEGEIDVTGRVTE